MSDFYFIRHGQAGTRLKYDALSEIGQEQCRRLGEYMARQGVEFSRVIIGGLQRHKETAACVLAAYATDGVTIPDPVIDTAWNEFDLDAVYASVAPQLAKDDPAFASAYVAMQQQVAEHGAIEESTINRRWNSCDGGVITAWVDGRYAVDCESWKAFRARIEGAFRQLVASNPDGNVLIFTSATPTAISVAAAMELSEKKMFNLASVMINSSMSVLRLSNGEVRMFNFNAVPHLDDAALRTHR